MEQTPKHFALQIGALISLYVSLSAFLILIFGLVNISLPDAADSYWQIQNSQSSVRYAIAALIVFFPAYLALTRMVNQARRNATNLYYTLTKWVVYISLLVGGLVMLGDLVAVILTFLNGEITIRFILKAVALLLVVGAAFWYYWNDAKGYWNNHEKESVRAGALVLVLVIAGIVYGFYSIDSPAVVREVRLDEQQLTDLQDIQWHIEAFYSRNEQLPETLTDSYTDTEAPTAPDGRMAYSYRATGDTIYELCATFAAATPDTERSIARPMADVDYNPNNYNWEHGVGEKCFERTVTKVKALQ